MLLTVYVALVHCFEFYGRFFVLMIIYSAEGSSLGFTIIIKV